MTQNHVSQIINNAMKLADELKVEIAVSIVDKGGHLAGFMRTENCSFATIEVSKMKASTACAFGMPTDAIGELVQTNPFMKKAFESFKEIFYFGGGLPILLDNIIIGGIGVAGVNPVQDKDIAGKSIIDHK
jgi:glc operon protein GlcG